MGSNEPIEPNMSRLMNKHILNSHWVGPGLVLVVIETRFRPNSNSVESCTWVVLNYASFVVLG